jgi:hypothetical protein
MTPPVVLASSAWAGLIIFLLLYFVPSVVAFVRHHHNQWAIFALNLLLGWTLLGWVGALVWSLTRPAVQPHRPCHTRARTGSYSTRIAPRAADQLNACQRLELRSDAGEAGARCR